MARSRPTARPVGVRGDGDAGQMMILSAVILLIGFIALAGMVSRVNQLATQTSTESSQSVLAQVGPLTEALDRTLAELNGGRTVTATWTTANAQVNAASAVFFPEDVGRHVTGAGIDAQTVVLSYQSPTRITLSDTPSGAGTNAVLTIGVFRATTVTASTPCGSITCSTVTANAAFFRGPFSPTTSSPDVGLAVSGLGLRPGNRIVSVSSATSAVISPGAISVQANVDLTMGTFALGAASTPTMETAAIAFLEHLQSMQASLGLMLTWSILCGAGPDGVEGNGDDTLAGSKAVVQLTDGAVWLELRSRPLFTRTTACTTPLSG